MDLKTSQNQYTISLDAIDLNFIPTISKYNGHEVTQIWTTKNLTRRDNEYYEFEIMNESETEDGGIVNQNALAPCYICNTDIPKIFIRDHVNSNKHKIFQKIINASLDRMKKVLSNKIVHESKCKDESIYFCETCVAVVNTQEKISHENSARHIKSLAADKILNDFLDLYIDNKEFSEGTDDGSNKRNCKNYNTLIRNNSGPNENNGNNTPSNQSTNYKIKESTCTNNTSQNQCVTLSEETQTAALPVKNDNLKCFPVKEDGQKKEEVPYQVVLKRGGTHINGNYFYCGICNMHVPNHNYNIYTHLTTAKHINNATKQAKEELIDVHYHMDLTKFPQLECLVCKKLLPLNNAHNVTAHTLGSTHQQNHKLMLSNNKITLSNGKYICNVCWVVINPMHEIIHCQTSSHLGKLPLCKIAKDTTSSNISQEDHKTRRYLLKNDLKHQLCLVCNVKVPKDINNVNSHLTGRVHIEKYNTKLSENKIHSQGNNFKCELCDVIVPTGDEIQHIQTATHRANAVGNGTKKAPSTLTSSTSISTADNKLRYYLLKNVDSEKKLCVLCNVHVPNNTNNIMSHLTERVHNEIYNTKLIENKIHSQGNNFKCELCDVIVPTGGEIQHIQTATHRANAVGNGTKKAPSTSTSSTSISTADNKLRTYLLKNDGCDKKVCLVCNVLFINNINNIVSHLTERVHNDKYNTKLSENKIRSQGNDFKCELCDVIVPTGDEIQHIQTATHRANAVGNGTKKAPSTSTSSTSISTEDNKIRTYLLNNIDSEKKLCLVCNFHVPNDANNIISHLTGWVHNLKYNTKLIENKFRPQGNNFKCELCDVIVPTGGEIQHIQTRTHCANAVMKVTKEAPSTSASSTSTDYSTEDNELRTYLLENVDSKKKLCLVCNVHVPNNNNDIISHLSGAHHNKKHENTLSENDMYLLDNDYKCELCDVIVPTGSEIQHIMSEPHKTGIAIKKHCVLC